MTRLSPRPPTTQGHRSPLRPVDDRVHPALIVGFPAPDCWRLPPLKSPVGRGWLLDQGRDDPEVSSQHLRFDRRGPALWVEDLGSRNGTWLNGQPLPPTQSAELTDGSVLRLGSTLLVYRSAFEGRDAPCPPLGGVMVGPYGLRPVEAALAAWRRRPPSNVLILGETGTGKELAARLVAQSVGRGDRYVAVNLAGIPAGLFEAQLFGHVAGAFSDARRSARGVLAAHDGGAVLLDEIGDLPSALQPKLLRVLENREVLPVGADRPIPVDVLLIAATNRSLSEMVAEGQFRQDLFARFATARLELPPLRQRREDIFAVAQALAQGIGHGLPPESCEVEAVERLLLCPWETNARELQGVLARAAALDPEPGVRMWAVDKVMGDAPLASVPLHHEAVLAALEQCDHNESEAARRLGISRGKLRRLLHKT